MPNKVIKSIPNEFMMKQLKLANIAVFRVSLKGEIIYSNPVFDLFLGINSDHNKSIVPDWFWNNNKIKSIREKILKDKIFTERNIHFNSPAQKKTATIEVELICDASKTPLFIDGIIKNIINDNKITDKEIAFQKLENIIKEKNFQIKESKKQLSEEISERINVDLEFHKLNRILYAQMKSSLDGIILTDNNEKVIFYNNNLLKMWGIDEKIIQNKKIENFVEFIKKIVFDPEDCIIFDNLENAEDVGENILMRELHLLDGRFYEVYRSRVFSSWDEYYGRIWNFREITEKKKTFASLRLAKEVAESANSAKSIFLSNISHEIRTPLNCIMGFTELISQEDSIKKIHLNSSMILRESEILLMLINDLLDHSKLEAGKIVLDFKPFDIRQLIEHFADIIKIKAQGKGLEFTVDVQDDVPKYFFGDPLRITQILMNLTGNAIKFTSNGFVGIFVEKSGIIGGNCYLKFSIIDTGIGIPSEKINLIFEPFTQADGSTTRIYGGTGLGTTISKQFVELMNGQIGVESTLGKGSTFWFEISLALASKDDLEIEPDFDSKEIYDEIIENKGLKILIAEDYLPNQEVVKMYLKSLKLFPDIVNNGYEALRACQIEDYDLILMDLQMPIMDGYKAVENIRQLKSPSSNAIIIGLTAHADPGTREKCLQKMMNDVITKPIRKITFLQTLLKWIRTIGKDTFLFEKKTILTDEPLKETIDDTSNPINIADGIRDFDEEEEIFFTVLNKFLETLEDQISEMTKNIQNKEFTLVQMEMHKIRGGAANLFAMRIANLAGDIEKYITDKRFDELEAIFNNFKTEFQILKDFIENENN